jgi:hypothetical protein
MIEEAFDFDTPTDVKAVIDSLPPAVGGRFNKPPVKPGTSRAKPVSHTNRGLAVLNELHPGKYWKCEFNTVDWKGMVSKKDILGFMDLQGVEAATGRFVAGQTTTPQQLSAHYRKYTSLDHTTGTDKVPIEHHVREFLKAGGLFYIITFEKVGARWTHKVYPFTLQTIDEIYSRKRKK